MAGPKRFTASDERSREAPNKPFVIDGVYARGHVPAGSDGTWSLELQAMGAPPLAAVGVLNSAQIFDERTGRSVWNPAAVVGFLEAVLVEEDVAKFVQLVADRNRLVELDKLADVLTWLSEEYTGRSPTTAPSSSSTGGAESGGGAAVGSLSAVPPSPAPGFPPPPQQ